MTQGEAAFFEETCAYGRLDGVCFVGHVNTVSGRGRGGRRPGGRLTHERAH